MKKLLTILLTITALSCVQLKSVPLANSSSSNKGFYYTLPKTFVNVEFSLKRTTTTKGIYFEYAECLGIPSEVLSKIKEGKIYSIDKVNITNNAYLDKENIYQLDLNQKFLNKSDFKLEYASNGELASAEISNESQLIPAITTTLNIIADIAGGTSFLGKAKSGYDCKNLPEFVKNELGELSDVNTAILKLLNSGPDNLSQEQLEYRLKELKAIKNNIISKFTATVKTKTSKYSFEFDPEQIGTTKDILKYDKTHGFERLYTTNPHNTSIANNEKLPFNHVFQSGETFKKVTIELVYEDKSVSQNIINSIENKKRETNASRAQAVPKVTNETNSEKKHIEEEGSFYYRIPANVRYKVMLDNTNIGEATLPVPQLGITLAAPKRLKNITFKLHPGLGSIYTVSGRTDSLRLGEIDSLRRTIFTDKNAKRIKELQEAIEIRNLENELSGESGEIEEEN